MLASEWGSCCCVVLDWGVLKRLLDDQHSGRSEGLLCPTRSDTFFGCAFLNPNGDRALHTFLEFPALSWGGEQ